MARLIWRPDTCGCEALVEVTATGEMTACLSLTPCAHHPKVTPADFLDVVHQGENVAKNAFLEAAAEVAPDRLVDVVDGRRALKPEHRRAWSFDKSRKLVLDLPLEAAEKVRLRSHLAGKFKGRPHAVK